MKNLTLILTILMLALGASAQPAQLDTVTPSSPVATSAGVMTLTGLATNLSYSTIRTNNTYGESLITAMNKCSTNFTLLWYTWTNALYRMTNSGQSNFFTTVYISAPTIQSNTWSLTTISNMLAPGGFGDFNSNGMAIYRMWNSNGAFYTVGHWP